MVRHSCSAHKGGRGTPRLATVGRFLEGFAETWEASFSSRNRCCDLLLCLYRPLFYLADFRLHPIKLAKGEGFVLHMGGVAYNSCRPRCQITVKFVGRAQQVTPNDSSVTSVAKLCRAHTHASADGGFLALCASCYLALSARRALYLLMRALLRSCSCY